MKHLLTLLLLLGCIMVNAQTISRDFQRDDYRVVQTSYETFATTKGMIKGKFKISLNCLCNEQDTIYQLIPIITLSGEPQTISKDAKMLLKMKDGKVITTISEDGVGKADYEYQVIGVYTYYYIFPIFNIDSDDLKVLINGECTKMRMECNWGQGYLERSANDGIHKKFYLSKTVKELYYVLKERLKVNNDIYEGF